MAKRRQYTADEFRDMKRRLETRRTDLGQAIVIAGERFTKESTFDNAIVCRDLSDSLVHVCNALANIDVAIRLADKSGKEWPGFNPAECGLE